MRPEISVTTPLPRGLGNLCDKKGVMRGGRRICIKTTDFRAAPLARGCWTSWRMSLNLNPQAQKAGLSYRVLPLWAY